MHQHLKNILFLNQFIFLVNIFILHSSSITFNFCKSLNEIHAFKIVEHTIFYKIRIGCEKIIPNFESYYEIWVFAVRTQSLIKITTESKKWKDGICRKQNHSMKNWIFCHKFELNDFLSKFLIFRIKKIKLVSSKTKLKQLNSRPWTYFSNWIYWNTFNKLF